MNATAAIRTGRGAWLAQAVIEACELELRALKPGNVGLHGGGHGMSAGDFSASAAAAAPALAAPGTRVGERILAAVQATRRAVACNTNLGIVLLAAPLARAALAAEGAGLRPALEAVLADLDVEDARLAYEAIRLAQPGGLGRSARHDVAEPPSVTLLEAMREAAGRDSIARQYAEGFADLWDLGVPLWREALARWGSREWAATAVYLNLMAWLPDTLVARKFGAAAAAACARRAGELAEALDRCADPDRLAWPLLEWDAELKRRGVNPGTSADLTVATMLAAAIEDALETEFTAAERNPGLRGKMTGESSRVTLPTV